MPRTSSAAKSSSHKDTGSPLAFVCAACQAGPFSYEGFRQAVSKGHYSATTGYSYTTTWPKISQSISNEGCHWCGIVRRTRDALPTEKFPPAGEENVEVRIQIDTGVRKGLTILLNGEKAADYTIYAKAGGSFFISLQLRIFSLII